MTSHGELALLKPDTKHLTLFYLIVAAGGALGGIFVVVLAPLMFNDYLEYEFGLLLTSGLLLLLHFPRRQFTGRAGFRRAVLIGGSVFFVGLAGFLGWNQYRGRGNMITKTRNFYGVLRVLEHGSTGTPSHRYALWYGQVRHGLQHRFPDRRTLTTTYYGRKSCVGFALENHPARSTYERPFRFGVIGLGVGILAAYANPPAFRDKRKFNDVLHFYEINPSVEYLAGRYFTFLSDAKVRGADIAVHRGDARLLLEKQLAEGDSQLFDVLVIDAFSGDAIPMHLLTREAFTLYNVHLKHDGILAVHITNRYLDLLPVVQHAAVRIGHQALLVQHDGLVMLDSNSSSEGMSVRFDDASTWILITSNRTFLDSEVIRQSATWLNDRNTRSVEWTDSYSSLFAVFK